MTEQKDRSLRSGFRERDFHQRRFRNAIRKLKTERDGEIEVGGRKLAASLAKLGVIDEYHIFLHTAVFGKCDPFFAGVQPKLRLVGSERIGERALKLTYAPT